MGISYVIIIIIIMPLYAYNFNIYLDNEIAESMHFNYVITANDLVHAKTKFKMYLEKNDESVKNFINKIAVGILDIDILKKRMGYNNASNKKKLTKIFDRYINTVADMLNDEIYVCIEKIYKIDSTIIGSMIIESDQGGGSCHHIVKENQIPNEHKSNINKILDINKNKISIVPYQKIQKKLCHELYPLVSFDSSEDI